MGFTINGYPVSLDSDTPYESPELWKMYEWKGRILYESDSIKQLRSDTIKSFAGASGGPCYKTSGLFTKKYSVIGIYSNKNDYYTYFTRINKGLYDWLGQYTA